MQGDERQPGARRSRDEAIDDTIREMTRAEPRDDAVAQIVTRVREAAAAETAGRARAPRETATESVTAEGRASGRRGFWWPQLAPRAVWACAAALLVAAAAGYWWQAREAQEHGTQQPSAIVAERGATGEIGDKTAARRPVAPGAPETAGAPAPDAATAPTRRPTPSDPRASSGGRAQRAVPSAAPGESTARPAARRRAGAVQVASVAATHAAAPDDAWPSDLPAPESAIVVGAIAPTLLTPAAALGVEPLRTSPLVVDTIPISTIDMPPVAPEQ